MIKNQNIICISSIDWDFVWQGHQEIMATLAQNGNRVLFIENTGVRVPAMRDIDRLKKRIFNWLHSLQGFKKKMDNLYVYSPVILPFPYSRVARLINKTLFLRPIQTWMNAMKFQSPIIWTFLPTGTALDIIDGIEGKLLIYYCIADFYKLASNPKKIKRTEDELIKKSDLIFVQGAELEKKCKFLNNNTHIFPFGVKMGAFEKFVYSKESVPEDIKVIKRPIVGYVGGIHRHIDFNLIRHAAETHPDWSIVLIGPVQTDASAIKGLKNVFFLDKKDFSALPSYISEFDVGIIPYKKSGYTETVYPTKMNEYHAMGKPVVSTGLPEVLKFNASNGNLVFIGSTPEEFTNAIAKVIEAKGRGCVRERIEAARKNSWDVRIKNMSDLIEHTLDGRREVDWQDIFIRFYKSSRRRTLKLCVLAATLYVLLFHTSFIWFLARPLLISDNPQKADAIVVFGGGVGETGSPGKSTIERARYAAELYKKGYADKIVFSSGYTYRHSDAENMKLFAISMGVNEKDIILEQRANSAYENVIFSKEILDKNKWNSILLISSPYNMRRLKLIFNKCGKEKRIFYAPVEKCQFYDRTEGAKLEQLNAIMHEYIGIIYYFKKGYI